MRENSNLTMVLGVIPVLALAIDAAVGFTRLPAWALVLLAGACVAGLWSLAGRSRLPAEGGADRLGDHAEEMAAMADAVAASMVGQSAVSRKMRTELHQVRQLVNDAVTSLQSAFNGLNACSARQGAVLSGLIASMVDTPGVEIAPETPGSRRGLAGPAGKDPRRFVGCDAQTRSNGIAMVEWVDKLESRMAHADELMDEVEVIVGQTNLLLLNVAAEAARAGGAGRGPSLLADDVRNLSRRSDRFINELRGVIGNAMAEIEGTRQMIADLAPQDTHSDIQSGKRMADTPGRAGSGNASVEGALDALSGISNEVDALVGDVVRSLQFEDIVSQLTRHAEKDLDRMDAIAGCLRDGLERLLPEAGQPPYARLSAFAALRGEIETLSGRMSQYDSRPVEQDSLGEGKVELF